MLVSSHIAWCGGHSRTLLNKDNNSHSLHMITLLLFTFQEQKRKQRVALERQLEEEQRMQAELSAQAMQTKRHLVEALAEVGTYVCRQNYLGSVKLWRKRLIAPFWKIFGVQVH